MSALIFNAENTSLNPRQWLFKFLDVTSVMWKSCLIIELQPKTFYLCNLNLFILKFINYQYIMHNLRLFSGLAIFVRDGHPKPYLDTFLEVYVECLKFVF